MNRHFQAKLAGDCNSYIFKTSLPILAKVCTTLKTPSILRGWSQKWV